MAKVEVQDIVKVYADLAKRKEELKRG